MRSAQLPGMALAWSEVTTSAASEPCCAYLVLTKASCSMQTDLTACATCTGRQHPLLPEQGVSCCADQLGLVLMAPLRYNDIPLSAVDFHISSIAEELLQSPQIQKAAAELAVDVRERGHAELMKRAMWLFRSGLNNKEPVSNVHGNKPEAEKASLQPLWTASQACADAWSANYVRRRFA